MASRQLGREHDHLTLQTTDLVHEAYLRLAGDSRVTQFGRPYFYDAAARAMRQVLVDAARRRKANKRGGNMRPVSLDDRMASAEAYGHELIELHEALRRLESLNSRQARVVECRFFGGSRSAKKERGACVTPS